MNLIKKTVILAGDKADGYVTVIRVGADTGAKIVGSDFVQGMRAGLKIGGKGTFYFELDGQKTEINLPDTDFRQSDSIGCVVLSGEKLVAKGGISVKVKDVSDHFRLTKSVTDTDAISEESSETASTLSEAPEQETTEAPERDETAESAETGSDSEKSSEESVENTSSEDGVDTLLDRLGAKDGAEFYNGVREKVEELFIVNPRENTLTEYLPNSEWVKIKYDGEDYYVVGKINENGRTVLLGYGVPGKKEIAPPKIADEIASWLSVPEMTDGYDGYWLIFQDAVTGEIVPIS